MKFLLALLIAGVCLVTSIATADDWVNGYMRSDGTYVNGYYRTSPDSTTLNNYSTQGNVNPYTVQPGTKSPYDSGYGSGGYGSGGYGGYGGYNQLNGDPAPLDSNGSGCPLC